MEKYQQYKKEKLDREERRANSVYLTGKMIAEMIRYTNKKQEEKNNEKNINS